jgi:DNA repair protein RecO (recombination protein O)
MEWTDEGIVLSARRHGETSAIVSLLTAEHGRHHGLVKGGAGRRARGMLQIGNEVHATWRARLAEHLGTYALELVVARAAALLDDGLRLAGLSAACGLLETALPEREPHADIHAATRALLDALGTNAHWPQVYVRWELGLLEALGYALDLSACAATGETDDLTHVSPKSGRAVSAGAAAPYRGRLLRLPGFLNGNGAASADAAADLQDGLALTGFFLERHIYAPHRLRMPAARTRLIDKLSEIATKSGI